MRTEDYYKDQQLKNARIRSMVDYIMGVLFFLIGLFFLSYGWFGITIMEKEHDSLDYLLAFVFGFYGIWRIYRGYKRVKNEESVQ